MSAEQGLKASAIRTFGFAKRELLGVFRQPRLIATLIIAPFVILLVFGLGYRTEPPAFETLLVVPSEDAELASDAESLSEAFGSAIDLVGTTTEAAEARALLRSGEIDLIIIAPVDALESIQGGEAAEVLIVHSQVDPVIRSSISIIARLSVAELNELILTEIVATAQSESGSVETTLEELRSETSNLLGAVEGGDTIEEERARDELRDLLERLESDTAAGDLYSSVSAAMGVEEGTLDALQTSLDAMESGGEALEDARRFEEQLGQLEARLSEVKDLDPALLVSPFDAVVEDIAQLPESPSLFYAPGAVILLLQHLALTFAALSLVRERQLGLTELFKASPLRSGEILVGKFAAFLLMSSVIAAVLTGAMLLLGVSLVGSPWQYTLIVVMVIVASLGLGFVLSSFAQTDSQAVQYTMTILLASIFFTGLVLPLDQVIPPVRVISYLLPATFGIGAMHDVMFRGLAPDDLLLWGLAAYGVVMLAGSWYVMRRHVRSEI